MLLHNMTALKQYSAILLIIVAFFLSACDIQLGYSVVGESSISGKQVDSILCSAGSPACGTGLFLHDLAIKYKVKVTFALAIFKHESTWGTKGVARSTKGIGNIRCYGWHKCIEGYRAYLTWNAGYVDFFNLIHVQYIGTWKLETVDAILEKYAPRADHNKTSEYISAVESDMDTFEGGGN